MAREMVLGRVYRISYGFGGKAFRLDRARAVRMESHPGDVIDGQVAITWVFEQNGEQVRIPQRRIYSLAEVRAPESEVQA